MTYRRWTRWGAGAWPIRVTTVYGGWRCSWDCCDSDRWWRRWRSRWLLFCADPTLVEAAGTRLPLWPATFASWRMFFLQWDSIQLHYHGHTLERAHWTLTSTSNGADFSTFFAEKQKNHRFLLQLLDFQLFFFVCLKVVEVWRRQELVPPHGTRLWSGLADRWAGSSPFYVPLRWQGRRSLSQPIGSWWRGGV